jgi:hypothetical protein
VLWLWPTTVGSIFTRPGQRGCLVEDIDRDRGTPHGAAPPTPPGIRVTYHGGSTELSRCRNIDLGETKLALKDSIPIYIRYK